jgi:hypothetical protein
MDAYCPRCRKEYRREDNFGTRQCRRHVSANCCKGGPNLYWHNYHKGYNQSGYNLPPSGLPVEPPGCTPCDHGDGSDILGWDNTDTYPRNITAETLYDTLTQSFKYTQQQALDKLQSIVNGALQGDTVIRRTD